MNEDKATRYHRLKRRATLANLGVRAAFLAGLVLSGASVQLRDGVARLAVQLPVESRPWGIVAAYVVLLAALHELLALPGAWYGGYVLDRRYGLSREDLGSWLCGRLRAAMLGLGIGLMAVSFVYFALRRWPTWWWAAAGLGFSLAAIALATVAPILLLPVFYRITPLERPALRDRLAALARRAGTPVLGVYEWNLGHKTRRGNAALVGLGGTRRILLADTLLEQYSDDEIEVILAHEIAHHAHRDIWKGILYESALALAGFYGAHRLLLAGSPTLALQGPADVAGLPLLALAALGLSVVLAPLANLVSRRHEYRADRFAIDLTNNPAAFVSAMRRLAAQNLAEEAPSRLVEWLFYSHPPINRRLAVARGAGPA